MARNNLLDCEMLSPFERKVGDILLAFRDEDIEYGNAMIAIEQFFIDDMKFTKKQGEKLPFPLLQNQQKGIDLPEELQVDEPEPEADMPGIPGVA
jgi:hypothetical protein